MDNPQLLKPGTSPPTEAEHVRGRPPTPFRKRLSADKFKQAGSAIMSSTASSDSSAADSCDSKCSYSRQSAINSMLTMDYKKECIKEEEEPPDTTTHNNYRIRKTNDRLFTQMAMKIPEDETMSFANSGDSQADVPCIHFPMNPRINIEKSLGSVGGSNLYINGNLSSDDTSIDCKSVSPNTASKTTLDLLGPTVVVSSPRQRKLSMPVTSNTSLELPSPALKRERSASPARRKFSTVSVAVTRKISTTMGWRSPAAEEVVPQAKYLCTQYIRSRLKRAGLLNKKLGLQRLRSVANMAGGWEVCEVFPRVSCLGQEMERCHPKLYGSVARQVSVALKSDKVVRHLMLAISSHMLRSDVTWARIISLYAVAASLAADCVRQGHPEFVSGVIEGVGVAIEQHSCQWIVNQGGWSGLLVWSQPPAFEPTPLEMVGLVGGAAVLVALLIGGAITLLGHLIS